MTTSLDLNPRYHVMVEKLLQEYLPSMTVWAYGSRVKGSATPGSDLDLVLINEGNASIPPKNLTALRAAFSDSNLPISVNILDWSQIPEDFQHEIRQAYVVLQEPYDHSGCLREMFKIKRKSNPLRLVFGSNKQRLFIFVGVAILALVAVWFFFSDDENIMMWANFGLLASVSFAVVWSTDYLFKKDYRWWYETFPSIRELYYFSWRDASIIYFADCLKKQNKLNLSFLKKALSACDEELKDEQAIKRNSLFESKFLGIVLAGGITSLMQFMLGLNNKAGFIFILQTLAFSVIFVTFFWVFDDSRIYRIKKIKYILKKILDLELYK